MKRLEEHDKRAPEKLSQKDLRDYVAYLRTKRKYGASMLTLQMAGIRYLFAVTLGKPEMVAWMSWPRLRDELRVREKRRAPSESSGCASITRRRRVSRAAH